MDQLIENGGGEPGSQTEKRFRPGDILRGP